MKTINSIAGKYNVDIDKAKELLEKKGVDVSDVDAELDLENEMLVEEILSVQQRFVQLEAGMKPGKMIETRVYPTYETKKDGMQGCSTFLWIFVCGLLLVVIIFFASMYSKAKSEEISKADSSSSLSSYSHSDGDGLSSVYDESSYSGNGMESIEDDEAKFSYSWYDEATGKQWQYDAELSLELYEEYMQSEAVDLSEIASDNRAYQYLDDIVSEFSLVCEDGENADQTLVAMIISFVQSLDYAENSEKVSPKYAYTTLYEKCGDDEDLAVLMATLLKLADKDAVVLKFEGRTAVGLALEGAEIEGTFFEYDSKKYYYVDTVAGSYAIGAIPEDYAQAVPEIVDFDIAVPEQ